MNDTANVIHQQLTERARIVSNMIEGVATMTPMPMPEPVLADPVYDFEHLGLRIAETLVVAAEAQVAEANTLLEQTKALAESIRSQVKIQTEALANLNGRLKTFGSELLEAHRKFNGSS
jgi:hypothetical protein